MSASSARDIDGGHYESVLPYLRYPPLIDPSERSEIRLVDFASEDASRHDKQFTDSERFECHISTKAKPHARIVSICSRSSITPLQITERALRWLMKLYEIDADFFDIVVSFGDKPRNSDAGLGEMKVKQRADGSYDMQYLLTHADEYKIHGSTKWTIRQIGVFHRYNPSGDGNIWIFLHAKPSSKLQLQLEARLSEYTSALWQDWFSLHSLVLSSYLVNWRWCIRGLGDQLENSANIALTRDLSKSEGIDQNVLLELLKPQHLGDVILPLSSWMGVAQATVSKMQEINTLLYSKNVSTEDNYDRVTGDLASYKVNLEGHLRSVRVLERKAQGISDLLAVALSQRNQAVIIDINQSMLKLTDEGFDDNATVKVVTLVTLIYLPASFVSTILGMNLFDFGNGKLSISRQFWIFIVLAVPLTLLTLAMWYFVTQRQLRNRQKMKSKRKEEELMV
ncbi:hypothetical protein BO94DRAFT_592680 [Aspergillus sclerotioniger CBS 115572]|uniref:CorA-like transporter domain-containing protein n=1 Tax=Aspergillus sclerotioniger CBS 115572 TaxID=1450535 RepID=A0A317XDM0_9EURO|nr:hypothetical protein BO94DRAFT_592680 [Aspergillus sclerotioniger CBS 115572]PWY96716.1 hypothetical protein BO94DRAFT_592680 [Aspergillus sclerotioniger CBS 115572]